MKHPIIMGILIIVFSRHKQHSLVKEGKLKKSITHSFGPPILFFLWGALFILLSSAQSWGQSANNSSSTSVGWNRFNRYISIPQMDSNIQDLLKTMGNRLMKKGKERVILKGTITTGSDNSNTPFILVRENPGFLFIRKGVGTDEKIIKSNGMRIGKVEGVLSSQEQDLANSLLEDFPDRFYFVLANGNGSRRLVGRFHLDGSKAEGEESPAYFIYALRAPTRFGDASSCVNKSYFFNEQTRLLEQALYWDSQGDGKTENIILYEEWQRIDDQFLPTHITRLVNGQSVYDLRINSSQFNPTSDDGTFSLP
jgi:hypothetical protein